MYILGYIEYFIHLEILDVMAEPPKAGGGESLFLRAKSCADSRSIVRDNDGARKLLSWSLILVVPLFRQIRPLDATKFRTRLAVGVSKSSVKDPARAVGPPFRTRGNTESLLLKATDQNRSAYLRCVGRCSLLQKHHVVHRPSRACTLPVEHQDRPVYLQSFQLVVICWGV